MCHGPQYTGVMLVRTKVFLQHHLGHLGEMLGLQLLRLRQLIPHALLPVLVEEDAQNVFQMQAILCLPQAGDPETSLTQTYAFTNDTS